MKFEKDMHAFNFPIYHCLVPQTMASFFLNLTTSAIYDIPLNEGHSHLYFANERILTIILLCALTSL